MSVKNLEIEEIIAFDEHLPQLLVLYFQNNKGIFLTLKNH